MRVSLAGSWKWRAILGVTRVCTIFRRRSADTTIHVSVSLAHKRLDISDDSVLVRLGVTYGVLRRLGYSEETVARCLESIDGVDLEEAHEWVRDLFFFYLHRI